MTMSEKDCSPVKETHISGDNKGIYAKLDVKHYLDMTSFGVYDILGLFFHLEKQFLYYI